MPADAVTQTSIVNAAAALLGVAERLTSMDDSGNLALHARSVWALAIRPLIADHPWNFAIRRTQLNPGAAVAPWLASYAKPADCLRLLSWTDCDGRTRPGVVEADAILTDAAAPVHVRYLTDEVIADPARWTPHLVQAATFALAAQLAEPITGQRGLAQAMDERAEITLRRARRLDGLESQTAAPRDAVRGQSRWLRNAARPYWRQD